VGFLVMATWPVRAEVTGDNWPGFRGDGSGLSAAQELPVHWSATENVLWTVEVPEAGYSSPTIWGHRLFLTAGTLGTTSRLVLCYDADTGRLLWQTKLQMAEVPRIYAEAGPAPATPVTDGKRVYAFFEGLGLVALDLGGSLLWKAPLGPCNNVNSLGSSPLVYQDTVILCCDQQAEGFIAAFDGASGAVRWRTPRNLGSHWSTPLLIDYQGRAQVVVGARTVVSYDPDSGQELWSCRGLSPNVAPSPVFSDGLVWATSGRNGPSMAVDPGGRGDVTDTAVRMYYPVGGPYVPSPVVYPLLMLPGDDGHARFLNLRGEVVAERRLPGHFSASPLGAAGRIYWTSETGDTYVLDASRLTASPPEVKVIAVNRLGEKCLASPAVSRGRLYLRGAKHLFCIAGGGTAGAAAPSALPPASFAELKERYAQHPAAEGPEVAVRIEVVEAMAQVRDPQAVPFLVEATLNDPHWDVCEAAAKALGQQGEAAVPALRSLVGDRRPFIRIIAAQNLGQLGAAAGVPELVKMLGEGDALSRLAALQALGEITRGHGEVTEATVPSLLARLKDEEAAVRAGAAEALGRAQVAAGDLRETGVRALLDALADRSSLVTAAARRALTESYQVSREAIMEDEILYGAQRPAATVAPLTAGPIRLKFQDGELRYLYVGEREIVRRVYFAVRDSRWDTVMPEFSRLEVKPSPDGFRVELAARCRNDVADYSWTGEILGSADGKITFRVSGAANADFQSPRIGLNVLFGSDSLAGTAFETTDTAGKVTPGLFPVLISPALLTGQWARLACRTGAGVGLTCRLTGAEAGMEDQRNFGDSSYKAYSSLPYKYPNVAKGERQEETLELSVTGGPAVGRPGPVRALVGATPEEARLPKLGAPPGAGEAVSFLQINRKPDSFRAAKAITMSFNPAAHMPDEDTFMENLTALTDQVATVRAIAPEAKLKMGPINFDSPYPRPEPDPRNRGRFAAAWAVAAWMEVIRAAVPEACFTLGPGAQPVLQALSAAAGSPLLPTKLFGLPPLPVRAQAALVKGEPVLWLVNQTAEKQTVLVGGVEGRTEVGLVRFVGEEPPAGAVAGRAAVSRGVLRLELAPYEVCEVNLGHRP
jgi:outer membrane protein assembly factor BamB